MTDSTEDIKKANAFIESAIKHLKKGFFKGPNWDKAANDYEEAAKIFASVGDIGQACASWENAYDAHKKAGNTLLAGRAIESHALLLEELARKSPNDGAKCLMNAFNAYDDAFKYYGLNCKTDNQVRVLRKAVQFIRAATPATPLSASVLKNASDEERRAFFQRAICFLQGAVDFLEEHVDENATYVVQLSEIFQILMLLHIQSGDIAASVAVLKRQLGVDEKDVRRKGVFELLSQPNKVAKTVLEIIVLCLSCGDDIWARQELEKVQNVPGFLGSDEEIVTRLLLTSFEERDVQQLQDALKSQTLQFINADISRMARKITLRFNVKEGAACVPSTFQQQRLFAQPGEKEVEGRQEPDIDEEEDLR